MIFIAELGDNTQLAVAGLAVTESPVGVWLGSSCALILTSAIGVYVGKLWVSQLDPAKLQKLSGLLFLLLAGYGVFKLVS